MHNLKFRRQFLLTNKNINVNDFWEKHSFEINGITWHLKLHPDLEFTSEKNNDSFIIILGYLIDPDHPEYDNNAIIRYLLSINNLSKILTCSDKYNGRFVIIYKHQDEFFIFHDATGFREVYYTFENNLSACGSTPDIIAENSGIKKTNDSEILSFYNSEALRKHSYTWIGYKTLYENIKHLPPNHYLDLRSKTITRYWPVQQLHKIDIDTCAEECASILKGTISGAIKRFKIHMGITAGWDTRLLLAASKEFKKDIYYYINKPSSYADTHRDIKIAKLLSKKLEFDLHVLDIPDEVDPEFKKYYYANNILAHETHLNIFYTVYKNKWDDTYTLSGAMGNGLARIYMLYPENIPITGNNIAVIAGYHDFKYVVDELEDWAKQVKDMCLAYNIKLMDLYQMEQENPHWASLTSSEQDISREEIRPFNNRKLIELFWSLDDRYRYQYYPIIYVKIMKILWKDVFKYPINPSIKSRLYKILRTIGIEQKIYNLYKYQKLKIAQQRS